MRFRSLCVSALLVFAISSFSHAQSLGDLARQVRAEQQKNGAAHPRVITNDDLSSPELQPQVTPKNETEDGSASDGGEQKRTAKSADAATDGSTAAADKGEAKSSKKSDQARPNPAKESDSQETEIQKRTDEINKRYLDRIATLREQINATQAEIAKLQREKVESTYQFQRTAAASPTLSTYEEEQRSFNEQIETHQKLIESLNAQLEDAREAARHAGVPHALDY